MVVMILIGGDNGGDDDCNNYDKAAEYFLWIHF